MKNKKKIIVALVIIALGVFSYTTYAENMRLQDQIESADARFVDNANFSCSGYDPSYELGQNGCYMQYAMEYGVPEICEKITSNLRFDCYRQVAGIRSDISVCESIVAFDGAIKEKDPQLNEPNMTASMEKAACYDDVAFKSKNPNVCKNIDDVDMRNHCQACASGESAEDAWSCGPLNLLPEHL